MVLSEPPAPRLLAGTSGFSYDAWEGSFYPERLPADARLAYYAERLPAVEINNTFYRLPKSHVVEGWAAAVPDSFRFVIKASRRITHMGKLRGVEDSVGFLLKQSALLGDKLGGILFQLPPWFRADLPLLGDFLALLPPTVPAMFEFRHASWFDDATYALLRERGVALVGGDPEDGDGAGGALAGSSSGDGALPVVATAPHGYLRLRAPDYDDAALDAWVERIRREPWREVYVFLKHEVNGPALAAALAARWRGEPSTLARARAPTRTGATEAAVPLPATAAPPPTTAAPSPATAARRARSRAAPTPGSTPEAPPTPEATPAARKPRRRKPAP